MLQNSTSNISYSRQPEIDLIAVLRFAASDWCMLLQATNRNICSRLVFTICLQIVLFSNILVEHCRSTHRFSNIFRNTKTKPLFCTKYIYWTFFCFIQNQIIVIFSLFHRFNYILAVFFQLYNIFQLQETELSNNIVFLYD